MPFRHLLGVGVLALLLPTILYSQASAYIPLDDPRMPAIELLIARGEIRDPSPMLRPIREADLRMVIGEVPTFLRFGPGSQGPLHLAEVAAWQRVSLAGATDQRIAAGLTAATGYTTEGRLQ